MTELKTHINGNKTIDFYNYRYAQGYMVEWPEYKKNRIIEIISNIELPETGVALDFGCGNGIFTDVLGKVLPIGWKVYGVDISLNAIDNAKYRFPNCIFFLLKDRSFKQNKFDFIFTHHVLEHVDHLENVLKEINKLLKPKSSVLHILPCGNQGSYEYNLCLLHKNGIDVNKHNRFFFEDEGHVRRLTTSQLEYYYNKYNFKLVKQLYSNQHFGAIKWMTDSSLSFLKIITNPQNAVNFSAKYKLNRIRFKLYFIKLLRYMAKAVEIRLKIKNKSFRNYFYLK